MAEAHKWEFKARFRRHAFAICVRTERDPKLRKELESAPKAHAELRRYREAGASAVALYRFAEPSMDAFFTTAFMQDYSEAVFIEGDCPIDYVDLSVFVAPVPSRGTRCSDGSFVLRSNRKGQTDQTIARTIWPARCAAQQRHPGCAHPAATRQRRGDAWEGRLPRLRQRGGQQHLLGLLPIARRR